MIQWLIDYVWIAHAINASAPFVLIAILLLWGRAKAKEAGE